MDRAALAGLLLEMKERFSQCGTSDNKRCYVSKSAGADEYGLRWVGSAATALFLFWLSRVWLIHHRQKQPKPSI